MLDRRLSADSAERHISPEARVCIGI